MVNVQEHISSPPMSYEQFSSAHLTHSTPIGVGNWGEWRSPRGHVHKQNNETQQDECMFLYLFIWHNNLQFCVQFSGENSHMSPIIIIIICYSH
jgi:hypothetical protein